MTRYSFESIVPLEVTDMAGQPCHMCSQTCVISSMCVLRMDTTHYALCSPKCLNKFIRERTQK